MDVSRPPLVAVKPPERPVHKARAPLAQEPPAPAPKASSQKDTLPSLAQFAINQMANRSTPEKAPASTEGPMVVGKSLSIFKDTETGKYVTITRNPITGEVEQIPDEKALEAYSRVARDLDALLERHTTPQGLDIET